MKQLLFLLLIPATLFAQVPDPKPNTYVNDLANVLTDQEEAIINQQVNQLEIKYSVQIAIVLTGDLPENYQIEDYAREIGRKWHVGNARNGLVYVAAINKRRQRLEVAANLEGIITDATALHLTDDIKPYFRNKDYAGGLLNLVKNIDGLINPEAQEQRKLAEAEEQKRAEKAFNTFLTVIFWLLGIGVIIILIGYILNRRKKKQTAAEPVYQPSTIPSRYSGSSNYIAPIIVNNESNNYSGYSRKDDDSYNSRSSGYDSGSSSSSDYGNWGSGSSDSSSSYDSGFSGGGSSNDW